MKKNNKQLTLPGLNEALTNSSLIKLDSFTDATNKPSARIIDFQKHRLKMDREEEKREIDSFLDHYKIF